jgi:hypothetical protein
MVLLLITSIALATRHVFFSTILALQIAGYAVVLLGHVAPGIRRMLPVRLAYFFVQANLALLHAGIEFLRGRRIVTWEPSAR